MNIGGRVAHMCLSRFMDEKYLYDSPITNRGPLRRTLARCIQHCLGRVHPRDVINTSCVDRGVSLPTVDLHLDNFLNLSPTQVSE